MIINLILKDIVKENEFSTAKILEKIDEALKSNITKLIIAPAYYDEESKTSIEEVKVIVSDVNKYLEEKKLNLKLYSGNLIRDNFENLKEYSIGKLGNIEDTNYSILSIEESQSVLEIIEVIYEFNLRNTMPILYGVEKIKEIREDSKKLEKLLKEECLFMIDPCILKGDYGKKMQKISKTLLKNKVYSFIGFEDSIKGEYLTNEVKEINKKSISILSDKKVSKSNLTNKKKIKVGIFK